MLLLIEEAKYKLVFGGRQKTFSIKKIAKHVIEQRFSAKQSCHVTLIVVDECHTM